MATQIQLRRGNTAQTSIFTGAIAEVTVDTDKKTLVIHDGSTAGGIPLSKESTTSTIFNHANGAFDKANSANVLAQAGYNQANTATTSAQAAFDKANQTAQLAFTTVSANGTSLVADANNDTLTITSAVANGVFVSANASTDALDIGLINSGVTASGYGDSVSVPTFVVDTKGRLTSASNTSIRSGTTTQTGIVQLQDSVISTSTSNAATPASVKTAYDLANTANINAVNAGTYANAAFAKANSANVIAQAAFDNSNTKFSSSGGTISGDTTVTGNLIINGTTTTVNTSTVSTTDSLLKLANNNTAGDSLDIGFYGTYNATGQKYAGLVRQAGSNFFLFKDLTTDPTSNALATGSLTAANTATLRANITGGTVSSLASAIGVADGGTGATTLTAGRILIGSGTSAVTTLANTGTAATYANASHVPVITTDAYGRVSAVTNTAIVISAAAITSGTLAVAQGGTGVITSTGTGSVVLNTSPILTTPNIGTPSFAVLTNATGLPVSGITASTSTALGVGSVELGHASDTTLSRSSAGVLAVEGVVVPTVSSTSTLTNKTLTFPIIDNIKMGFTTTATAAGTTTLTSASNHYQRFTGSTTQTVVLPVTSTLVAGVAYEIENASTGNLTVNSSGGNLVVTIIPGVTVQCRCIGTALTTAADWDPEYNEFAAITGTGAVVLNTAPTLTSINVTNTTTSTSNTTGAITVSGGVGIKGNVVADGIIFPDNTRQTSAGASIGDALSLAIALG